MLNRDNTYLKDNKFAKGTKPNKTSFKKGMIPWNKGKKGIHLSPESEWKKGRAGTLGNQQPALPLLSVTQRKDKNGTTRNWIKTKEPNTWASYAVYLYEQAGYKLKRGYCIHHINNNSSDDRIENLIQVSRQDHPKLHNRWNTKNK